MSKDTTADRAALQQAATLVRPALADKAYIKALVHVCFDGKRAQAYNEKLGISVRCETPLRRLVPGVLLVQGLASFGGKDVLFQQGADDSLVLKSGAARVKLPTLPIEDWPLKWPEMPADEVTLTAEVVRAVERCLVSVGTDGAHPAHMGVTLTADGEGRAVLYSTDNKTVSVARTAAKARLPGDAPVIMPRAFCEQVVALWKAFPETEAVLGIGEGFLAVYFWEGEEVAASLFSRVPVDLEPMDFPRIVRKHCGELDGLKRRMAVIPDAFDAALGRALLVLGGEVVKKAEVRVQGGELRLRASTDMGDADDSMKLDADDVGPVLVPADCVARGLKGQSLIAITDTVTILADAGCGFVHIAAHVRDVKV